MAETKLMSETPGEGDTRRQHITVIHNKVAPAACHTHTKAQQMCSNNPSNRHRLFSVPHFYDGSNKTTRKLHGKVTKITPLKKPFFLFVLGYRDLTAGKESPGQAGVNSYTRIPLLHTNVGEQNRAREVFVQTDHLHIKLGERRNQKIQLVHLRCSKLLSPPKPICRLKRTPTVLCVCALTVVCICSSLLTIKAGISFRMRPFSLQVHNVY